MLERSKKFKEMSERKIKINSELKKIGITNDTCIKFPVSSVQKMFNSGMSPEEVHENFMTVLQMNFIFDMYKFLFELNKVNVSELNLMINARNIRDLKDVNFSYDAMEFIKFCKLVFEEMDVPNGLITLMEILDEVFPDMDSKELDNDERLFKHLVRLKCQIDKSKKTKKYVDGNKILEKKLVLQK